MYLLSVTALHFLIHHAFASKSLYQHKATRVKVLQVLFKAHTISSNGSGQTTNWKFCTAVILMSARLRTKIAENSKQQHCHGYRCFLIHFRPHHLTTCTDKSGRFVCHGAEISILSTTPLRILYYCKICTRFIISLAFFLLNGDPPVIYNNSGIDESTFGTLYFQIDLSERGYPLL
jgi:hypothetical protein